MKKFDFSAMLRMSCDGWRICRQKSPSNYKGWPESWKPKLHGWRAVGEPLAPNAVRRLALSLGPRQI